MFSQVSVCRGVSAFGPGEGVCHSPRQTPPGADTPHPVHAGIHTPCSVHAQIHPPAQCMLGYGQQAGRTHPTGMHSCIWPIFFQNLREKSEPIETTYPSLEQFILFYLAQKQVQM